MKKILISFACFILLVFLNGIIYIAISATTLSTHPINSATGAPIYLPISVRFSEPMDSATLDLSLNPTVSGTLNYEENQILRYDYDRIEGLYFTEDCYRALFSPTDYLSENTTYTATVSGGGLDLPYSWSFTTGNFLSVKGEFEIESYANYARHKPAVAMDENGNYIVAWQTHDGIYAQRYDPWGNRVGNTGIVTTGFYSDYHGPSVALSSNGEFAVAWMEEIKWSNRPNRFNIYVRKYFVDPDTGKVTTAHQLNMWHEIDTTIYNYPDKFQSLFDAFGGPSVGIDANGRYVVVYQLPTCNVFCDRHIYGYLFDTNSNVIKMLGTDYPDDASAAPVVNHPPTYDEPNWGCYGTWDEIRDFAYYPTVSMAPDGRFVVAWVEWQCTEYDNVKARIFNSNGNPVTGEFQVNTYQSPYSTYGYDQWIPYPAINNNGDIVIVWGSQNQEGRYNGGIYGRLYNYYSGSTPLTDEFHINTYIQDDQWGPSVAIDPDGNFVVAWQSNGQDCGGHGIYTRRYDSSGTPLGPEFRANKYNSIMLDTEEMSNREQSEKLWTERPGIAMNSYGDFVIVWGSYDHEVDRTVTPGSGWQEGTASYGEGYGIYANIYINLDGDKDGISEDGDGSGTIGDNPCTVYYFRVSVTILQPVGASLKVFDSLKIRDVFDNYIYT